MRPYIICHVLSSLDGRIDGGVLRSLIGKGEYEETGAELKADSPSPIPNPPFGCEVSHLIPPRTSFVA